MMSINSDNKQTHTVSSFLELVNTPFQGSVNAMCWSRELGGDFAEIANKLKQRDDIAVIDEEELLSLSLSEKGIVARDIVLNDLQLLRDYGAAPTLNLLKCYERDVENPGFPTDVYSWHVDRSPIPTSTFLCTYYGASSDIVPNSQAEKKILVPEIRRELRKLFSGNDDEFDVFLTENFYDLHYQAKANENIVNLGIGHLWRLAVDHPESKVPPCIHRAPKEKEGESRLMLIC
jgi:hypothetical protein